MLVEINLVTIQVGPTYGRKMMTGYVRSKGLTLSDEWIQSIMRDEGKTPDEEEIRFRITRPTMETSYTVIKMKN